MKTAVSLPNDLFSAADRLARRLGVSRSQLYASALREYIAAREQENLTERINAVCEKVNSTPDPALRKAQRRVLLRETW
jgi:metal-responsive CopG/Arc/MetJ family transcriptional regulator